MRRKTFSARRVEGIHEGMREAEALDLPEVAGFWSQATGLPVPGTFAKQNDPGQKDIYSAGTSKKVSDDGHPVQAVR
jgi:hypothetical protein